MFMGAWPSGPAEKLSLSVDVPDYGFIPYEPFPAPRGIVWAHSLGASPPWYPGIVWDVMMAVADSQAATRERQRQARNARSRKRFKERKEAGRLPYKDLEKAREAGRRHYQRHREEEIARIAEMKRTKYAGTCVNCGGPTLGPNGPGSAPDYCGKPECRSEQRKGRLFRPRIYHEIVELTKTHRIGG